MEHGELSVMMDLTTRMQELSVKCLDSAGNAHSIIQCFKLLLKFNFLISIYHDFQLIFYFKLFPQQIVQ